MSAFCPICASVDTFSCIDNYTKCLSCGHEFQSFVVDTNIANDILSLAEVKKFGLLESFKTKVLRYCAKNYDLLVDIGSASGKFLFHNKKLFKEHIGIEVTERCLIFSKKQLGLNVVARLVDSFNRKISVVTFWHSLEHISVECAGDILNIIRKNSTPEIVLIISVPNADSLMYKLFKKNWAFYDSKSHFHQFTSSSLDTLFGNHGFERSCSFGSFVYALFGYLQSFLNVFNKDHNFFYYSQKRGETSHKTKVEIFRLFIYNICLIVVFLPISLILAIFDVIFIKNGAVLTICYQSKKPLM